MYDKVLGTVEARLVAVTADSPLIAEFDKVTCLECTMLHCTILCYTMPYCTNYTVPTPTTNYTVPTTLYYTYYTMLHYAILY